MRKSRLVSEETRKKISEAHKGKKASKETRAKMRATRKGKPSVRKGKTYEEIYGPEKAKELRKARAVQFKGKSYKEMYGEEKAKELTAQRCKSQKKAWSDEVSRQSRSGGNHYNYKGGNKEYGQEWTAELREEVRERDGHKCQECRLTEVKHRTRLHVHHIDYDKKNCIEENLITLCKSCHGKVSLLRSTEDYYLEYYTWKVLEIYEHSA